MISSKIVKTVSEIIISRGMKITCGDIGAAGGIDAFSNLVVSNGLGSCDAFEPNEDQCNLLEVTYAESDAVSVFNIALGASGGIGSFHLNGTQSSFKGLEEWSIREGQSRALVKKMEVMTLSQFARSAQPVRSYDFLKIDAERSEIDILKGYEQIGECTACFIEYSHNPDDGNYFGDLNRFMWQHGFKLMGMVSGEDGFGCPCVGDGLWIRDFGHLQAAGCLSIERLLKLVLVSVHFGYLHYAQAAIDLARRIDTIDEQEYGSLIDKLEGVCHIGSSLENFPLATRLANFINLLTSNLLLPPYRRKGVVSANCIPQRYWWVRIPVRFGQPLKDKIGQYCEERVEKRGRIGCAVWYPTSLFRKSQLRR